MNKLSFFCVATTEEVADDTFVARLILRLVQKTLVGFRAFEEMVDAIDMLWWVLRGSNIPFKPCRCPNALRCQCHFLTKHKQRSRFPCQ